MYYAFLFDFALVGLVLCTAIFLVWSWIGFIEDHSPHPIYRQSAATQRQTAATESAKKALQHAGVETSVRHAG